MSDQSFLSIDQVSNILGLRTNRVVHQGRSPAEFESNTWHFPRGSHPVMPRWKP